MNELTRTAVRSLDFVQGSVRARPAVALAIAGFAAASSVVVAGGQVGTATSVIPLTDWFGLQAVRARHGIDYLPGTLMRCGIIALLMLWLVAIRLHHSGTCSERSVWFIGGAWATPFVIGPPVLSNDVWSYAAQGLLLRSGLDPYSVGPSALGNVPAVAAVDPSWRSATSPYGPLATTAQHLAIAISGGSPLGAVIVFRALGLACFIAIGLLAADLAGPRRVQALTLTILNPLVLLHVVSGAHLDGLLCALLLGAMVAVHQRRWLLALILASAAASVKAPAFAAVLAIVVVHSEGMRGRDLWRTAARDVAVAAVSVAAFAAVVADGWGWVHVVNAPALGRTPLAPASLLADLYDPIVAGASFDDLAAGGRITSMVAAVCIVGYLTVTAYQRPLARTIGYGLLALGFLGPALYPWYLLWGIVCLAPTARTARRDWIVIISGFACFLSQPGLSTTASVILSLVALLIAAAIVAPRALARRRTAAASAQVAMTVEALPAPDSPGGRSDAPASPGEPGVSVGG
jgi:hypothetical protein